MAKKSLKNEIRKEKDKKETIENEEVVEERVVKVKPKKKRMTENEKRKLIMKIVGWIMAISMIGGSLIALFAPLMYK